MFDADNQAKFSAYRLKYPEFHYQAYHARLADEVLYLTFDFSIPCLAEFHPELRISLKGAPSPNLESPIIKNLIFHIGLVELISYWKCTASPHVIIECGELSLEQIAWWKKLYFYGLGEFFYRNHIKTTSDDFMQISCADSAPDLSVYEKSSRPLDGYIVLIGGGKDSVVTLETLPLDPSRDYCLIVNPRPTTRACAELAGFSDDRIIEIYRTIDSRLLELNRQGFLNGHIPFSAMLAFVSYLAAYLFGKKYVVASNESSANESNLPAQNSADRANSNSAKTDDAEPCGCASTAKVNHQYSKSFEFEQDFDYYAQKYLKAAVQYFSFLRPLNELQIAKLFSRLKPYHSVFRSCNVGSKSDPWVWCGECAKCLFAYIILSPYLYPKELPEIFGQDLFEKPSLAPLLDELTGHGETKPFDCVGTFSEVNFALTKTIKNLESAHQTLPYLLNYYRKTYGLVDLEPNLELAYNTENLLTPEQDQLLRHEVFDHE